MGHNGLDFACYNVYLGDTVYLVTEIFHTDSRIA